MSFSPRERLESFHQGMEKAKQEMPKTGEAFFNFTGTAQSKGALTRREKKLIAIALSIYTRCEDCIVHHVYEALKLGLTRKEILDAAGVGLVFGGGPSFGAVASMLIASLDEFEKDTKKKGSKR